MRVSDTNHEADNHSPDEIKFRNQCGQQRKFECFLHYLGYLIGVTFIRLSSNAKIKLLWFKEVRRVGWYSDLR